ncbi:hypothetical protein V3N99_03495 [Dermatophilaceae bacterium Soc4.6]
MQATVHRFDETTRAGSVLLDDGHEWAFSPEVFDGSALRHLRPGQRVSIDGDASTVTRLWVVGIGPGETIG